MFQTADLMPKMVAAKVLTMIMTAVIEHGRNWDRVFSNKNDEN